MELLSGVQKRLDEPAARNQWQVSWDTQTKLLFVTMHTSSAYVQAAFDREGPDTS